MNRFHRINRSIGTLVIITAIFGFAFLPDARAQTNLEGEPVKSILYEKDNSKERPIPHPVIPSTQFEDAVSQGSRTVSGKPGNNYWTNYSEYNLKATLSPEDEMLRGQGTITYHNRSPDTLRRLVLHLRQNLYRKGTIRNRGAAITGGMELSELQLNGTRLANRSGRNQTGYRVQATLLYINPPNPIAPGENAELQLAWNFEIPPAFGSRMGQDGEVFYLGYWYPQMAVYDDVNGWYAQPYMGDGEFYMGYADYQVDITVPEGWLVGATGQATNYKKVLSTRAYKQLQQTKQSDSVISVVNANQRNPGSSTRKSDDGMLTWKFQANNVRDFAFGASDQYVWDVTRAQTRSDDQGLIHSFYRPEYKSWHHGAQYTRFAIEHLSKQLAPYPWPQMTIMEGILRGGMEYPMITIIASNKSKRSLFGTIYHETAHMWFPMMVGSNEKRYTWMDEGLVTFLTQEGKIAYWPDADPWAPGESGYYYIAGSGDEIPVMRHGDRYPVYGAARGIASYSKPGLMLHTLRGILGERTFYEAFQTYVNRWTYKHPYPYDLFNTFEEVAGRDLDWFWTSTLYETWTLDQAIAEVRPNATPIQITVKDKDLLPMPVTVQCTYQDGTTETTEIPVETWLNGNRSASVECPSGNLQRVELDPEHYLPDVDRSNNEWEK